MKKEIRFYLVAALAGCLSVLCASSTYSQTCEVDGPNGTWKTICSGTSCDCSQGWGGAQVSIDEVIGSASNTTTVVALMDDMKIIETLGCQNWYPATSCGTPGEDDGACCNYYLSHRPANPTWPPCVDEGADFMSKQSATLCNSSVCGSYSRGCVTCDAEGGVHERSGIYAWDDPHIKIVKGRTLYQWVCNTCTAIYTAKVSECGGVQNILTWDNATCTGQCRPCVVEYAAKITECGSAQNIVNWNDATCTGECLNPGQNLEKCQN